MLTSTFSLPKRSTVRSSKRLGEAVVGDAARHGECRPACRFDLAHDGLGRLRVEVVDDDGRALASEPARGGGADPAPRSGDDDDLILEKRHGGSGVK